MQMHDLTRFNFTVHKDPEINRMIAGQLREIAEELQALLGDRLIAVLIAGGFGRGEGGIVRDDRGIRPVNDYDLYVVVKRLKQTRRVFGQRIEALAQACSARFGIKQIDMGLVSRWQLLVPRNSITRYEAKEGHRIVYGPEHIGIRSIRAEQIPLEEGTQYFFTRGGGLLIARYILENRSRLSEMPWFENFSIEMNKAVIALGDAELIRRRKYTWSYVERLRRFESLDDPECESLKSLYRSAVEQKLKPTFESVPAASELEESWTKLATQMVERFLIFESNRFRYVCPNLQVYMSLIGSANFNWSGKLYNRLYAFYSGARQPELDQQRLTVYLLLAGFNNTDCLCTAEQLLKVEIKEGASEGDRWLHAVSIFLKKWHPEGLVGVLLNEEMNMVK